MATTTSRRPPVCVPWRARGRPGPPSQGFYREEGYRTLGHTSLEAFLVEYWERWALSLARANDILSQISTWLRSDIGANELHGGHFEAALAAIEARAIVMPGRTDTYFPPEDSEYEVAHMPNAELRPIPSDWGPLGGIGKTFGRYGVHRSRAQGPAGAPRALAFPMERRHSTGAGRPAYPLHWRGRWRACPLKTVQGVRP